MTTGVVRHLVDKHGYGFISNSRGKDIFFHHSQLRGITFQSLKKGQGVTYKVGLGEKGFIAKEIKPCDFVS
jgi:CspA family cold shock protein